MKNNKFAKGVVLFLALLTAFAFAPFVFSPPQSPPDNRVNSGNDDVDISTSTVVNTD